MTTVPVFVGRTREVELLRRSIERTREGAPSIVTVTGEAGIGKSRLAREAMNDARALGFAVLEASCFPHSASTAYGPFRDLMRGRHDATLEALLGAGPLLSPVAIDERRRQAFVGWRQWLEASAGGAPLLLCIEDLHWCDEMSLELLVEIALRPLETRCLVLATFRADEPSASLPAWRASIDRSRRVLEIALEPLGAHESAALLHGMFGEGNAPSAEASHALHELAQGHPFFLEELAKTLGADALADAGAWASTTLPVHVPRSIRDATSTRLSRLDPRARELLDLGAVEGRGFDATFLGKVLRTDERDLALRLRLLVDAHFIVELSADRFSFRHALIREAVFVRQLTRERRELHLAIARALVASGSSDVDALARHWFGAEAWEEALANAVAAAEGAFALHAFRAARDHWRRALEAAKLLGRATSPDWQRSSGLAHELLDEFDAAHEAYEASLDSACEQAAPLAAWQALVSLGRLWTRRDYLRAGVFFERARETAMTLPDGLVQAESSNAMGMWLLNIGRDAEAIAMHESVLPLLEAEEHAGARARTLDRLGMSSGLGGRLAAGVAAYDRAVELWRRLDDPRALAASLQGRAVFGSLVLAETVPSSSRSSSDCLRDAMESVRLAERLRLPSQEAFARMGLACVHAARDEIGPALAEADACRRVAKSAGHDEWAVSGRFFRGLALMRIFAAEEARDTLRELLPDAERTGSAWWSCNTRAYLALSCIHGHDIAGATELLREDGGRLGSAAERRLDWARAELALLRRDGPGARAILDARLAGHPGDGRAPIPLLLFLQGSALSLERRHASAAQVLVRARDAAVTAGGLGLELRIHAALATALSALGRSDDAERATASMNVAREALIARAAEAGHEAACRAGIDRVLSPPGRVALRKREAGRFAGLTRREREIVESVAQGATNAEIARKLSVSPRTVETHVENILAKLGFKSRVEIAVWATKRLS
jgi:DNA-binding CsgD family transcriptional regulator/tetratricopeptide (TPR) repeat protein